MQLESIRSKSVNNWEEKDFIFFFFEKALNNLLNSRNHRNSFEDISGLEKKCFHRL